MEIVMESIQELLRKLCKCIVKSDDGLDYITISKQETPTPPTPPTPPEPEKPDLDKFDPNVPFCIENVGDEPVVFCTYNYYSTARSYCEISYDNKTWKPYELKNSSKNPPTDISKISPIVLANKGDRVYFKMDDYTNTSGYTTFYFFNDNQGIKVRARGNIASLNHGRNEAYKTNYLEIDETHAGCYNNMFGKCASLIQAPDLPATKLARQCYCAMFQGCTGLTQAPELPATELATSCYLIMFGWCTSLTQAPELPATTLATACYKNMFQNCTSLVKAPNLPAPIISNEQDYQEMFRNCKSLNYIKCMATHVMNAPGSYIRLTNWVTGVSSTGDFYTPKDTLWRTAEDGIPQGWTRHDIT